MTRRTTTAIGAAVVLLLMAGGAASQAGSFRQLKRLPPPTITAHATEYPGGSFRAAFLLDGQNQTEFASHGKGAETFVEFDFGRPVLIAGFWHQDRNDVATIKGSELTFMDAAGAVLDKQRVAHVNQSGGVTAWPLARPVTAQRVRWQIVEPGTQHSCLGGAEVAFFTAEAPEPLPRGVAITPAPSAILQRIDGRIVQPLRLTVDYPYAEPCDAVLEIEGVEPEKLRLSWGRHEVRVSMPELKERRTARHALRVGGERVVAGEWPLEPVRPLTLYLLPHSHVDIGYTEHQSEIEKKQVGNLARALELIRATANYPEGARYKWNVEVLWPVESFLRQATPERRREFFDAVRQGQIGLQAMYGNVLTGLCRPEELLQLFAYATRLGRECGGPVDNAMISDVPGYTWGVISAMAQAGVKYWSIGPNFRDRIGATRAAWEDKPFYWLGPSGKDKVLCALPYNGYALSHLTPPERKSARVMEFLDYLHEIKYPYDIVHWRWAGYGDNAVPDETLPDWVKAWNQQYASPRLAIATCAEFFREFEKRWGDRLPSAAGDWTPYWEDGAGSTSRETALNRASADRLVQAEALWAMLAPNRRPAAAFTDAWRNVLLYSEHTWGAYCSISKPDDPFTTSQWATKKAFADDADRQSRAVLSGALAERGAAPPRVAAIDVFNTTQWPRSDLALVPSGLELIGDQAVDADGRPAPTQRLATGELALWARDVPPFGAKRYRLLPGPAKPEGAAQASGHRLSTALLSVELDAATGAVKSLRRSGIEADFVDGKAAVAVNDFRYLLGVDPAQAKVNGPATIDVLEAGPLVASLRVTSDAPGCRKLVREVRVVDGMDRVELVNHVDRLAVREKDAVHFGFGFHVPSGQIRIETPWAVVRPNADQLPGACFNWYSVQRWVDISNTDRGVTWAPLDAPLMEIGAITANLLGPVPLSEWRTKALDSQTIYSWAQNNHWHTNYKADQPGVTTFRYVLRPHGGGYSGVEAARFGVETTRPLIAVPANPDQPVPASLLLLDPPDALIETLKASDDGRGFVVRLFGVSGRDSKVSLRWAKPMRQWHSDLSEQPGQLVSGPVLVPAHGLVIVRAEP
jgi:alpha-mannosidase